MRAAVNLNHALIANDINEPEYPLTDPGFEGEIGGTVGVYFRDLAQHLIQHIEAADVVLGCVAWLTDERILGALAKKSEVSIIVQKEDFLRPDGDSTKTKLRRMYRALQPATRMCMNGVGAQLSVCSDDTVDAVRCVGVRGNGGRVSPRSHHKFVVFARIQPGQYDDEPGLYEPYAVWTGSFNFTWNGGMSLENALVLSDPAVVQAYYAEYQQVLALSEELDWFGEYMAPQWRIGT